jgi:hypothetical protein
MDFQNLIWKKEFLKKIKEGTVLGPIFGPRLHDEGMTHGLN